MAHDDRVAGGMVVSPGFDPQVVRAFLVSVS
jgi:hypothetical protein